MEILEILSDSTDHLPPMTPAERAEKEAEERRAFVATGEGFFIFSPPRFGHQDPA